MLQRQNIKNQINQRFTPASDLQIGTFVLLPNFQTQKGISKKLHPLRKGPYQIIDKPTEVTYKLIDTAKKEIVQHRNNLLPYYPKEYALREITQLYSFTGLKVVQNNTQIQTKINENYKNQHTQNQKQNRNHKNANTQNTDNPEKERKNRKMIEKNLTTRTKRKVLTSRIIKTQKPTTKKL